jgi:hypothetical protein
VSLIEQNIGKDQVWEWKIKNSVLRYLLSMQMRWGGEEFGQHGAHKAQMDFLGSECGWRREEICSVLFFR